MNRILAIVDDKEVLTRIQTIILEEFPYIILFTATNGSDGIDLAGTKDPDVILLDSNLQGESGVEICRGLKTNIRLRKIPIVFITSTTDNREIRKEVLAIGVEAFLYKPIDEIDLIAHLRALIKLDLTIRKQNREILGDAGHIPDTVDEKWGENYLRKSEKLLGSLISSTPDFISLHDREGKFLFLNHFSEGFSRKDFEGKMYTDFLGEETKYLYQKAFEESRRTLAPRNVEHTALGDHHTLRDFCTYFVPIVEEGALAMMMVISRDITDQRIAREDLIKSEERLIQVAKCSGIWIWEVDAQGKYTYCSQSEESILGYKAHEIVGQMHFYDFFVPEIKDQLTKNALDVFATRQSFNNLEHPCIHKNGHLVILEKSGTPILDSEGNLTGYRGTDKDISARIITEAELENLVAGLNAILDSTGDGILVADENGKISHYNKKMLELWKVPETCFQSGMDGELLAYAIGNLKDLEQYLQRIDEIKLKDEDTTFDVLEFIDGRVLERYSKSQRVGGKSIGRVWSFHDITQLKNDEEELKNKSAFIQTVLDNLPIGVSLNQIDSGSALYENKKFVEIYGWPEEELRETSTFFQKVYPDEKYRTELTSKIKIDIQSGDPARMRWDDCRITHKDGSIHYVNAVNIPLYEQNMMVSTVFDMTGIKKAEESLMQSTALNETLIRTIPFGINIVDMDGNILFQNENFEKIYGKEAIGKKCWSICSDDNIQCAECPLRSEIGVRETILIETSRVFGGRIFQISHTGMTYKGENAILEIFQDITEQKKNTDELILAKEKAEESNRLKSSFLSNMNHEIRTPMNAISGFSNLLAEADDLDKNEYAEIIQKSSEQLLILVDDVLLLSRLQSGRLPVISTQFSPAGLVQNVSQLFQIPGQYGNLEFKVTIPDQYRNSIFVSDENKIMQVLTCLASNAAKYTEKGFVEIGFDVQNQVIEFFVKDSGIGISESDQQRVFDTFFRSEQAIALAIKGTGLGLNIAKELVELMGGKIGVTSVKGEGSRFYFSVPAEQPEPVKNAKSISTKEENNYSDLNLLIVDDELLNCQLIEVLLRGLVKNIDFAFDGQEAIDKASKEKFDLVLMDLKMPVMGGLEAAMIIKSKDASIKIIAQTAFTLPEEQELAFQAGCDEILTKPIIKKKLLEIIRKLVSDPSLSARALTISDDMHPN